MASRRRHERSLANMLKGLLRVTPRGLHSVLPPILNPGHVLPQLIGCYFGCWRSRRRQLLKFAYQKRPGHPPYVWVCVCVCNVLLQALAVPAALWIYEHNINLFLQTFHVFVWATQNGKSACHTHSHTASRPPPTRTTKGLLCQFAYMCKDAHVLSAPLCVWVRAAFSCVLSSTFQVYLCVCRILNENLNVKVTRRLLPLENGRKCGSGKMGKWEDVVGQVEI